MWLTSKRKGQLHSLKILYLHVLFSLQVVTLVLKEQYVLFSIVRMEVLWYVNQLLNAVQMKQQHHWGHVIGGIIQPYNLHVNLLLWANLLFWGLWTVYQKMCDAWLFNYLVNKTVTITAIPFKCRGSACLAIVCDAQSWGSFNGSILQVKHYFFFDNFTCKNHHKFRRVH